MVKCFVVKKCIRRFVVTPKKTIVKADLESDLAPLASRISPTFLGIFWGIAGIAMNQ